MTTFSTSDLQQLIMLIGGKNNIYSVSHCLTRLRFVLNDTTKANVEKSKSFGMKFK